MLDLEHQLREYGAFLDEIDTEIETDTVVVAVPTRSRSRLVAAAVAVVLLSGGGIALAAGRDTHDHVTIGGSGNADTTTTQTPESAIVTEQPTFAQQVARLEGWYANAVADAPGGRPILNSEYEVCDYRGGPDIGSNVQGGFASYFPLAQKLTGARLAYGCLRRDDIPDGTTSPYHLCSSQRRGPVYDSTPVVAIVTKPVVMLGTSTDCAAAGYDPFPPGLFDELNDRRRIEIEMWAVPRSCPTRQDATLWAEKVSKDETGTAWSVVAPSAPDADTTQTVPPSSVTPPAGNCVRAERIDWDLQRVSLARF